MAKIGLYFGSFNPVHIGHMAIAGYMTEFAGLDQLWFVVSPHNPLKKKETLLADHHRLYMSQLAIGDSQKLKTTDIEFKLPVPSYTIDTLTYLKERYPKNEFSLVWVKTICLHFINGKMQLNLLAGTRFIFIRDLIQKDSHHFFSIRYYKELIFIR